MKRSMMLGAAVLLVSVGIANAQPTTTKCAAAKIKCAIAKATGLLACHALAEKKNAPVAPACLAKVEQKFTFPTKGCIEKAEAKPPCFTTGDAAALEAVIDAFVLDVVTELDPGYPAAVLNRCSAGKKKCVANKLKAILGCHRKDVLEPNPSLVAACVAKAQAKFDGGAFPAKGCFEKLEAHPPCLTLDDTAALEAKVDAFALGLRNGLAAPTTLTLKWIDPPNPTGETRDASSNVIQTLACGGLDIGDGGVAVPEVLLPDGALSLFGLTLISGTNFTIGPTSIPPPVNTAGPDCTDVGCNFGTPLPIALGALSTCVLNRWGAAPTGVVDLSTGITTMDVVVASEFYVTGNATQPCPRCNTTGTPSIPGTDFCDNRGPRALLQCTTTNSVGLTRDCPTDGTDGVSLGTLTVTLSPLSTGVSTKTNAGGLFCPGQTTPGCFGSGACVTITEQGAAAAITLGTPAPTTLVSVFCIPGTGNGLFDGAYGLPGPGAVSLPGFFLAQ